MEFWEALLKLGDYDIKSGKYLCQVCGHTTNHCWSISRHVDLKHPDELYELSGQAHGWNNAAMGCKD